MQIRPAQPQDFTQILEIYQAARLYMKTHGNPNQWGETHPEQVTLEADLHKKQLYVLTGADGKIHAAFVFCWASIRVMPTLTVPGFPTAHMAVSTALQAMECGTAYSGKSRLLPRRGPPPSGSTHMRIIILCSTQLSRQALSAAAQSVCPTAAPASPTNT